MPTTNPHANGGLPGTSPTGQAGARPNPGSLRARFPMGAAQREVTQVRQLVEDLHQQVRGCYEVLDDVATNLAKGQIFDDDRGTFFLDAAAARLADLRDRCAVAATLGDQVMDHLERATVAVGQVRRAIDHVRTPDGARPAPDSSHPAPAAPTRPTQTTLDPAIDGTALEVLQVRVDALTDVLALAKPAAISAVSHLRLARGLPPREEPWNGLSANTRNLTAGASKVDVELGRADEGVSHLSRAIGAAQGGTDRTVEQLDRLAAVEISTAAAARLAGSRQLSSADPAAITRAAGPAVAAR